MFELEKTDDGLPPISISVGVVNGKDVNDVESLFQMTDAAMYESKKKESTLIPFSILLCLLKVHFPINPEIADETVYFGYSSVYS